MRIFSVDIGGTNIKAGLLDEVGNIYDCVEHPTPESGGPEAVASAILFIKDNIFGSDCAIDGVGVGVAGPVDSDGVVYSPPNFRGWGIIDLKSLLAELLDYLPSRIFVGNDASLAALAEFVRGNGKKANPMVMITIGTGIGGGILIDGKLLAGKDGFAGELGHMVIDPDGPRCGCGRRGCAEALIAHKGIVRTAWEVLRKDKGSIMWSLIEGRFDRLTPKVVQQAASLGDPAANKVLDIIARRMGTFLANVINLFNPEKIVIGGGIALWSDMIKKARIYAVRQALKPLSDDVRIVRARYIKMAGVVGAAIFAARSLTQTR